MTLNHLRGSSLGDLENVEYPFIITAPTSTLTGGYAPDRVQSMDQIEQAVYKQMTDFKLWLL